MYDDEDIASAIAAGVLSEEAATAFRAHVAERKRALAVDEENFRLVTGFNDIFVVIACLLLLASLAWIGSSVQTWLGAAAVAAASWGLAEFFTRKRGMALPSIMLLLAFVASIPFACLFLGGYSSSSFLFAGALSALAAWLHWQRFRVPITVAAGAAAIVVCVGGFLLWAVPEWRAFTPLILLAAGLAVFALAMRWDASDTVRQTRRSDVAFWLHLLAAPLLVHPVFTLLGVSDGQINTTQGMAVLALYVAIALVSLAIDRRALMVSALFYVLYTFSALLNQFGVVSLGFAITALVIGSALLLLSAFWHPTRALVLGRLPAPLQKHLAPFK